MRKDRDGDSGGQIVAMMQIAEPWHRGNPVCSRRWSYSLLHGTHAYPSECEMRPDVVVVVNALLHQASWMSFVQDGLMVEQIAATVLNPALGSAVLPRTLEARSLGWMPKLLTVSITPSLNCAPRSKIRQLGAESYGDASRDCCITGALLGCLVTWQRSQRRLARIGEADDRRPVGHAGGQR